MPYTRLPATSSNATARQALLSAFAKLALSRRYRDFGVGAIVSVANVARSTFYYHFAGKDDLLLQNLRPFIAALADIPFTDEPSAELEQWIAHIWQQRGFAGRLLDGTTGRMIETALVDGLNDAFEVQALFVVSHPSLLAHQIAGASLSLLKAWVGHRVTATPREIARTLWSAARSTVLGASDRP